MALTDLTIDNDRKLIWMFSCSNFSPALILSTFTLMINLQELKLKVEVPIARHFHKCPSHFSLNTFIGSILHFGSLADSLNSGIAIVFLSLTMRYKYVNSNFLFWYSAEGLSICVLSIFLSRIHIPLETHCGVANSRMICFWDKHTVKKLSHNELTSLTLCLFTSICDYCTCFVIIILHFCPILKICY